jgi:hypothetical protein
MKNIISALLLFLCTPLAATAQQDTPKVDPENICIDVNYMMPQRYPTRAVTDFSLCLKGDTVISHLPYMGQAHRPTFGNTDGLRFKLPIKDKSTKTGKKGKTIIRFSCTNSNATYDFKIETYPDGGAYISLTPSHADRISYKGEWHTEK